MLKPTQRISCQQNSTMALWLLTNRLQKSTLKWRLLWYLVLTWQWQVSPSYLPSVFHPSASWKRGRRIYQDGPESVAWTWSASMEYLLKMWGSDPWTGALTFLWGWLPLRVLDEQVEHLRLDKLFDESAGAARISRLAESPPVEGRRLAVPRTPDELAKVADRLHEKEQEGTGHHAIQLLQCCPNTRGRPPQHGS